MYTDEADHGESRTLLSRLITTQEKQLPDLWDSALCSSVTVPRDIQERSPSCREHDHKRERQARRLTSRFSFQAVKEHLRECVRHGNTSDSVLARQQAIAGFYCIFSALPYDLKAMVVAYLEPPDVATVQKTSVPSVCWRCPIWQETVVNHVTDTQRSLCDLVNNWDLAITKATIRAQFSTEASVLPRHSVSWRGSHYNHLIVGSDTREYLSGLWRLQTIAKRATGSIQAAFPQLAQGKLIQEALVYTAQWAIPSSISSNATKEAWLYFAHLSLSQRLSINNLFSNVAGIALDRAPFRYPTSCKDDYCYLRWEAAERRGHRSTFCSCCGNPTCAWSLPDRIEDELEALGVTELLARMWIVRRTRSLLLACSRHALDPGCAGEQCKVEHFSPEGCRADHFSWRPVLDTARMVSHGPHADIVITIPALKIIIVMTGKRGNGHIRIQIAPQFRQQCQEPMFMMMDAMALGYGEALDVDAWEQETEQGLGLLFETSRWCYWDLAEKNRWSGEAGSRNLFGLASLFR